MGWYDQKDMDPEGRLVSKVVTNRALHTFREKIGYNCLKDTRTKHFEVALHNILDDGIVEGKTLHVIYRRLALKQRIVLTNKNVTDHMYV